MIPSSERATDHALSGPRPTFPTRLAERFYRWRDNLVATPSFQRWSASFPLTRWVAARQSRQLFDLCAGFVYSQILAACVHLDLFQILSKGPQTALALAPRLGLSGDASERLLKAAVALGLLAVRGREASTGQSLYGLALKGTALLGNPGASAMIRHHALLYGDLTDPLALLRGEATARQTALGAFWPYAKENTPSASTGVSPYSQLMSLSQSLVVDDILAAYPFARHKHVMDVGGGDGTFLVSLAAHVPHLAVTLLDLPPVAKLATQRFAEAQIAHRASAFGANASTDDLPRGADLMTLVRVMHDHNDDKAKAILQAIFKALPDAGTLLIAEPMAEIKGVEPMGDAYFGFYLLAMGSGKPRSPAAIKRMLASVGFENIQLLRTRRPLLVSAITARKPVKAT
jgi:demethylspheroidene O-methyltransferase